MQLSMAAFGAMGFVNKTGTRDGEDCNSVPAWLVHTDHGLAFGAILAYAIVSESGDEYSAPR